MTTIEKNQVLLLVPLSFAIESDPLILDLVEDFFKDDGAVSWQAQGTQTSESHLLVNRVIYRPYDYVSRVLEGLAPDWSIVAFQSFDAGEEGNVKIFKQAIANNIIQFMNDVVEYGADGVEAGRSRPLTAYIDPPCIGASEWEFI